MKSWIGCIALSTAMLLSSCAGAESGLSPLAAAAPGPYTLGPGDQIRVSVYGFEAINNTYMVGDTGAISLPLLEPIEASGRTIQGVEGSIAEALKSRQIVLDPRVSVQVQVYRPFFITGEVQRPGQYPYVPGMSVLTAVSVAGGYTFRANTKSVTIRRAAAKAAGAPETSVQPGDLIVVRESWF